MMIHYNITDKMVALNLPTKSLYETCICKLMSHTTSTTLAVRSVIGVSQI